MPALHLADFLDEDLVFCDLPRLEKPELLKVLAAVSIYRSYRALRR